MTFYTDAQLVELLTNQESQLVERKRSGADRSGIRKNICAFANDLPGAGKSGVILIGVEDDGRCAGIDIDDELLRTLAQMRSDGNIQPVPSMTVDKVSVNGYQIAVIQVEPETRPPVRYQGRVWVKVGPTVQTATADEEQRLTERQRTANLPFDMRPVVDGSLDELDLDWVRAHYLPAAVAQDVLEQNRRPLMQQLRSLRLIVDERPTWAAMIACGRDPQGRVPGAYIQFLRIAGSALTDPIKDQKVLTGNLEGVLRRLDEILELNISIGLDVTAGPRDIRQPDYPVVALQQLSRNAVMHRSYEGTNAPTRIYWYADRIEMQNPGGLYGKVTPENIGTGATDYRNPLIAEIMHNLGYAQRFGMGIPLATKALADNGNPPLEPAFSPTHVSVTLRPAR
jgi:ATP-dependent DNA helicase RecG